MEPPVPVFAGSQGDYRVGSYLPRTGSQTIPSSRHSHPAPTGLIPPSPLASGCQLFTSLRNDCPSSPLASWLTCVPLLSSLQRLDFLSRNYTFRTMPFTGLLARACASAEKVSGRSDGAVQPSRGEPPSSGSRESVLWQQARLAVRDRYFISPREKYYMRALGQNPRKEKADFWASYPELAGDFRAPLFLLQDHGGAEGPEATPTSSRPSRTSSASPAPGAHAMPSGPGGAPSMFSSVLRISSPGLQVTGISMSAHA